MGVTIIITEKPSVAQEYRSALKVHSSGKQDGYIEGTCALLGDVVITWAVGHLVAICPPEKQNPEWDKWQKENLPMIPEHFKYEPQKATYKQFQTIQTLYKRPDVDCIYYAGDSGREGIYIQALIRNQIFKKTPSFPEKVVWIDSYTEDSILNGIKTAKPYADYLPMVESGYARAITDWLYGMNFTEAFTLKFAGYKTVLNVGRVMTPTLNMVVERQKEIDNFTKTPYFGIRAAFSDEDGADWKADKDSRFRDSELLYNESGFLKQEDAEKLIKELSAEMSLTVTGVTVQEKTEYAPYLFNLADLQAHCSRNFHISPAQTLSIAQSLYEKKFTTYPRTDSRFLTTAVAADLRKQGYAVPKRYIDDSKVTDHYALIPTFAGNPSTLSGLEAQVYQAIRKRFEDTMKPPHVYDAVSVIYGHKDGEHFYESFKNVKQAGWKAGEKLPSPRPVPVRGTKVSVEEYVLRAMETKPPASYTTGSLILAMEKAGKLIEDEELREQIKTCGIGTSATRANIIEKLKEKGFISVDRSQKISPTQNGKDLAALVARYDETLVSPVKTADMESHLNGIALGQLSQDDVLAQTVAYVKDTTARILAGSAGGNKIGGESGGAKGGAAKDGTAYACPCCGTTLKYGRYGWFCDCGFSLGLEICKHKTTEADLKSILQKGETRVLSFTSKAGKPFKAKLVLNKNTKKTEFVFENARS